MRQWIMNWIIIGTGIGFSPDRRQAISRTNAVLLRPFGMIFFEIVIGFLSFSFKKTHLKMSANMMSIFSRGAELNNYSGIL